MRQPLLCAPIVRGAAQVNSGPSGSWTAVLGLADRFAPLADPPPKRPVGPAARLRLPALELHVVALRPHAGLEDQREARRDDEHTARARAAATSGDTSDDRTTPSDEQGPFDNRIVDELPPLIAPDHARGCGMYGGSRKPLAGRVQSGLASVRRARGKSDQSCSRSRGRGPDGRDRRHCRLPGPRSPRGRSAGAALLGLPEFTIVGLADKAVAESRERVRAALASIGLALPPKRITVNLSPADLPKEGSHYDLPIALGLLAAIGATDAETLSHYVAVGELSLDGRIAASPGVLLAAIHASSLDKGLICPAAQGSEAAWAGRARRHRRARPAGACSRTSRARRWSRRRRGRGRSRRTPGPISPRSRGRKSPSARSRSPPQAATTC